ncbi:MAG: hypothetical protein LW750_07130 [Bacteroidetes bacterium]|nr:hypothetical protein [Bacteroidota bacterium]
MKTRFPLIVWIIITSLGASCGSDETDQRMDSIFNSDTLVHNAMNDSVRERIKQFVSTIPVPFDILNKLSNSKLVFNADILSNTAQVGQITDPNLQALNLGIYGADMALLITQSRLSDSGPYLKSVRTLADAIVVPNAFDETTMKRFDNNRNNQDSLQKLVFSSYMRVDTTLISNDRQALASLVLSGGWLESLYLTSTMIDSTEKDDKNATLYEIMEEQRLHLEQLTGLLQLFPDDSTCSQLAREMNALATIYPKGESLSPLQVSRIARETAITRQRFIPTR